MTAQPTNFDDALAYYRAKAEERDAATNAVVQAASLKKVVVAGPGTGKTALFAKLLEGAGGASLTLSFINALVDDLSLNLYGLSEVKTLHGFSVGLLQGNKGKAKVFPKLAKVIEQDAAILLQEPDADFDKIFQLGSGDDRLLRFYKVRKDYYGTYYGFGDAIYALVKLFEKDPSRIPKFKMLLVDEYQDFNLTEVMLIDLLATRSAVLLAGDDDQSLYSDFKGASPDHIRAKYQATSGYDAFSLPFCSRSTKVIVDAANDLILSAKTRQLLGGRIAKPYVYFANENKDAESKANPHILYTQQYEGEMLHFIEKQICAVAKVERQKFSVLIVMPPQLRNVSLPRLGKWLRKRGFRNVTFSDKRPEKEPVMIEGLKLLLKGLDDNLGWRIVARQLLAADEFEALVRDTTLDRRFHELIPEKTKIEVREMVRTLKKIRDGKEAKEGALQSLVRHLDYDPYKIVVQNIREDFLADDDGDSIAPRAVRSIPITITTIPSAKGLSADYVFITHFDDQYYTIGGVVNDREVFAFLVALTRAKKKAVLISSKDQKPELLGWIDPSRIEVRLDAPHTRRRPAVSVGAA